MSHSLAARVCTGSCVAVATTLVLLAVSGAAGFPEIALLVLCSVAVGALAVTLPNARRRTPVPVPAPAPRVPQPAAQVADYTPSRH